MGKPWKQWQTILGGSKITVDGDCSLDIKRHLLVGGKKKTMTNLDSIWKNRDITSLIKICIVKAMVFPVVMYGCESWTIKKAECRTTDAFELWCWRRLLRVPWTARRPKQSILQEWDGWMASPTWWTWVWVNSGSWWWTGRPGVLRFMGLQRVRQDWTTELNWAAELNTYSWASLRA